MPGLDPFAQLRPSPAGGGGPHHPADNNNLMEAAEKARLMMMYRSAGVMMNPAAAAGVPRPPLPLPPDLLARYSAVQATLGLYNPSLLAAALRTSTPPSSLPSAAAAAALLASQPPPPSLSPKITVSDLAKAPPRFSPYVLPPAGVPLPTSASSRTADSPSHFSTMSDGEPRSPSPRSSPPTSRPPFPLHSSPPTSRPPFPLQR